MENSSVIITVVLLVIILIFFLFASVGSRSVSKRRRNEIFRQLKDIKENIGLDINSANRDSIVRLDSLLSKVLKFVNKNTLPCGENLKLIKRKVKKNLYDDIWYYHKLRNKVVHENIEVTHEEINTAYKVYYNLITELI